MWIEDSEIGEWLAAISLFLASIFTLPLVIPLYALAVVYKLVVGYIVRIKFAGLAQRFSDYPVGQLTAGADAFTAERQNGKLFFGYVCFILGSVPGLEAVKQEVLAKLVERKTDEGKIRFPRLRTYIDSFCGLYFWNIDTSFDIDAHVRYIDDENIVGLDRLRLKIARLANDEPPGKGKSPWQVLLIPFREHPASNPKCVCLIKVHHALTDGTNMARVITDTVMTDCDGNLASEKIQEAVVTKFRQFKISPLQKFLLTAKSIVFIPYFVIVQALGTRDGDHALHREPLADLSHFSWSEPVPLDQFKRVRTARKCSVNDIFLTAWVGAMRRYFNENGAEIPEKCKFVCPVSLASPFTAPRMGNDLSLIIVRLPMRIGDPLARLQAVKRIMDRKKTSSDILINKWWIDLLCNTIPANLMRITKNAFRITGFVSNVPGPQFQTRMFGANVEHIYVPPPSIINSGLETMIISLGGNIACSVSINSNLEPDHNKVNDFSRYVKEEIDTICNL